MLLSIAKQNYELSEIQENAFSFEKWHFLCLHFVHLVAGK